MKQKKSNLQTFTNMLYDIDKIYNLDFIDLKIIAFAQKQWDKGDVRVTDFFMEHVIASPSTLHYRVTKHLVDEKIFSIKINSEDKREKFVVKGKKFNDPLNKVSL